MPEYRAACEPMNESPSSEPTCAVAAREAAVAPEPTSAKPSNPRGVDMTRGPLLGKVVLLAWPMVLTGLLHISVSIADVVMVGKLGSDAIAAVGFSRGIIFILVSMITAVATGMQVLVAQYRGSGDRQGMEATVRQGLLLCVPLTVLVLSPVGVIASGWMMRALGATEPVLAAGVPYLQCLFAGLLFLVLSYVLVAALQGAGDTITPLILLLVGNLINVGANYVCIFGVGPVPAMGVLGAAVGTIVARAFVSLVLVGIIFSGRFIVHVRWRGPWRLRRDLIKRIFYIGLPAGLEEILRNIGFMTIIKILTMTSAGMFAIAAFTVAGQIRMASIMIGLSLMGAAMTAVGQNCGAGEIERARRSAWITAGFAAVVSIVMATSYALLRHRLIMLFNTEPEVIRVGAEALLLLAFSEPFITASMSLAGALRGAGDTWWPLYVTAATFTAIGPLICYVLGIGFELQTIGVWLGLSISTVLGFIALAWHFRRGRWMGIRVT